MYHLLKPSEVNGDGALISSGTKCSHCDVGDGRNHHERGEMIEENGHKQMSQPRKLFHLLVLPAFHALAEQNKDKRERKKKKRKAKLVSPPYKKLISKHTERFKEHASIIIVFSSYSFKNVGLFFTVHFSINSRIKEIVTAQSEA